MEKLKIGNAEFNLIPMGMDEKNKLRVFTVEADSYSEVDQAFLDVSKVTVILADNSEVIYLDCVKTTSIKDNKDGTYTVEVSTDILAKEIQDIKKNIILAEVALVELFELMIGGV